MLQQFPNQVEQSDPGGFDAVDVLDGCDGPGCVVDLGV